VLEKGLSSSAGLLWVLFMLFSFCCVSWVCCGSCSVLVVGLGLGLNDRLVVGLGLNDWTMF
jgi:hypothetical protein